MSKPLDITSNSENYFNLNENKYSFEKYQYQIITS